MICRHRSLGRHPFFIFSYKWLLGTFASQECNSGKRLSRAVYICQRLSSSVNIWQRLTASVNAPSPPPLTYIPCNFLTFNPRAIPNTSRSLTLEFLLRGCSPSNSTELNYFYLQSFTFRLLLNVGHTLQMPPFMCSEPWKVCLGSKR